MSDGEDDNNPGEDLNARLERMRDVGLFGGNVAQGLDRLRLKLLDTSPRTRLLNFRHPRSSSLRVVDELPNQIFRSLLDGNTLSFKPVPKLTRAEEKAYEDEYRVQHQLPADATVPKISSIDRARKLGLNVDYELPLPKEGGDSRQAEKHRDSNIQTLLFPEEMSAILETLRRAARVGVEEKGINLLYLAIGFLEWVDREDSNQRRLAPLILVPVIVERGTVDRDTGIRRFSLSHSGEDIDENLSLREKFTREFDLTLPNLFSPDDPERPIEPEAYFKSFAGILKTKPNWKLHRSVSLALFEFSKLLMYRDLEANVWPPGKAISRNPLVRPFFETTDGSEDFLNDEYEDLDTPKAAKKAPHIFNADSSQHSVLVDVLTSKSLVVQGPPGTGKSQTITNIIGACMGAGKTVLFVSEKLAALEVVRRRMDDAGLGHFCLELHSHRTQKRALLEDLDRRLKLRKKFREPENLEAEQRRLERDRKSLQQYAFRVAQPWGKLAWSIQRILAAKVNAELQLGDLLSRLDSSKHPGIEFVDEVELENGDLLIGRFLDLHADIEAHYSSWERHPLFDWNNLKWTFADYDEYRTARQHFIQAINTVANGIGELEAIVGIQDRASLKSIIDMGRAVRKWQIPAGELPTIFSHFQEDDNRTLARNHIAKTKLLSKRKQRAFQYLVEGKQLNYERLAELRDILGNLGSLGLSKCSRAELRSRETTCRDAARAARESERGFRNLTTRIGAEAPFTAKGLIAAVAAISSASASPWAHLHFRSSVADSASASAAIIEGSASATRLREAGAALDAKYALRLLPTEESLANALRVLRSAGAFGFLRSDVRRARHTLRQISRNQARAAREEELSGLEMLLDYLSERKRFDVDSNLITFMGTLFSGVESRFEIALTIIRWREATRQRLNSTQHGHAIAEQLLVADENRLRQIASLSSHFAADLRHVENAIAAMSDLADIAAIKDLIRAEATISDVAEACLQHAEVISRFERAWEQSGLKADLSLVELENSIELLEELNRLAEEIKSEIKQNPFLSEIQDATEAKQAEIAVAIAFAEQVGSDRSSSVTNSLFSEPRRDKFAQFQTISLKLAVAAKEVDTAVCLLAKIVRPRDEGWPGLDYLNASVANIKHLADSLPERAGEVETVVGYVSVADSLRSLGAKNIVDGIRAGTLPPHAAKLARRYCIFKAMSEEILREHDEVARFRRVDMEDASQRFRRLDESLLDLHRELIAHSVDQRTVPKGPTSGRAADLSELNLITREIEKQKRHIPIRQLVKRAKNALIGLKPCFMMSPLSVAQYLPPGELDFDVVVMDEASQIRPEEALGAIARARQVVIVGDSRQLPPTSFFQRTQLLDDGDGNDDRNVAEEAESILEAATTVFPQRWLRWHYRSQHESLIAFSNRHFYDDQLVVLPSAKGNGGNLGVTFRFVRDGRFAGGKNVAEASAVVEAALAHMNSLKPESIGIVAMNIDQAELIESMVEEKLKAMPLAEEWIGKRNESAEPFFVKNLENVQGDERDIILASFTYGAGESGPPSQNFGPINRDYGWRRLNVLFTRARRQMVVFASMRYEQIAVDGVQKRSVSALRNYLRYAETGQLNEGRRTDRGPDSPFEEAVIRALKVRDLDCVSQVGSDKYRIDIGVLHPDRPGEFIVGVECDGAPYHSGKSVRDRDRIRQSVLESLGWRIHRIWSSDWYRDAASEINRLVARIEELRAADRRARDASISGEVQPPQSSPTEDGDVHAGRVAVGRSASEFRLSSTPTSAPVPTQLGMPLRVGSRADRSVSISRDEARAKLVALRENEIKPKHPSADPAKGLLRKTMLDKLVEQLPTTKDEFHSRIPLTLREATDGQQVQEYLKTVLELLADVRLD